MPTLVLVHGAWHGGWCWDKVARRTRSEGYTTLTPTLTGLAERQHLIDSVTGPDTHVADIVNLLTWNDLHDVVLVGHSYGGLVIAGVAAQCANRIKSLVYLDALVPQPGCHSAFSLTDPTRAAEIAASANDKGYLVPNGMERWVSSHNLDSIKHRLTPIPLVCIDQDVTLTGDEESVARRVYIICAHNKPSSYWQFKEAAEHQPGWHTRELPSLHSAMIETPDTLAEMLIEELSLPVEAEK